MAKGFARGAGALFLALGFASVLVGPTANGLVAGDLYHAALYFLSGIILLGFSFRSAAEASAAFLLVALLCMACTLMEYRMPDANSGHSRLDGIMAMVLASAAAVHMLRRPDSRRRAIS